MNNLKANVGNQLSEPFDKDGFNFYFNSAFDLIKKELKDITKMNETQESLAVSRNTVMVLASPQMSEIELEEKKDLKELAQANEAKSILEGLLHQEKKNLETLKAEMKAVCQRLEAERQEALNLKSMLNESQEEIRKIKIDWENERSKAEEERNLLQMELDSAKNELQSALKAKENLIKEKEKSQEEFAESLKEEKKLNEKLLEEIKGEKEAKNRIELELNELKKKSFETQKTTCKEGGTQVEELNLNNTNGEKIEGSFELRSGFLGKNYMVYKSQKKEIFKKVEERLKKEIRSKDIIIKRGEELIMALKQKLKKAELNEKLQEQEMEKVPNCRELIEREEINQTNEEKNELKELRKKLKDLEAENSHQRVTLKSLESQKTQNQSKIKELMEQIEILAQEKEDLERALINESS